MVGVADAAVSGAAADDREPSRREGRRRCLRLDTVEFPTGCAYPIGMPRPPQPSPIGVALVWASRIMAVGLAMFLPAVAGTWLDTRLGTGVFGGIGLVLGFVAGLGWIVQLGRRSRP